MLPMETGFCRRRSSTQQARGILDRFGVQGAETSIMKNFPFSTYRIKIMTVERPDKELQEHLEANGFNLIIGGNVSHFGEGR